MNIATVDHLDPDNFTCVQALILDVTDADGLRPLSEHVWLHLRSGGEHHDRHVLARDDDGRLIGYAHLDTADVVAGASAELAVHPEHRRSGVGRALIEELLRQAPDGRLRLWAHGEQSGAAELARLLGFEHSRVLWQMRRSLFAPLPRPQVPEGVEFRPFEVGRDESAWLDLNARAFSDLPDQARWTAGDLARRMSEPWFSPAGFIMAWQGDRLVGFHWTKVHGGDGHAHLHDPIGEVYVVGVDPAAAGRGLGRALTLAGLQHLRTLDLPQAMLYVDSSNLAAVRLYDSLGFVRWDTDVEFQRAQGNPRP